MPFSNEETCHVSLTMHLQSVILQSAVVPLPSNQADAFVFFNGLINQSFVRYVALCTHGFPAKQLISAYTRHYLCAKPCRQPSSTHRTVVINVLTIARGTIIIMGMVLYAMTPYTWICISLHGFVCHHSLYMVLHTIECMVLNTITRYTWCCILLGTCSCMPSFVMVSCLIVGYE